MQPAPELQFAMYGDRNATIERTKTQSLGWGGRHQVGRPVSHLAQCQSNRILRECA